MGGATIGFQGSRDPNFPVIQSAAKGIYYLWGGGTPFVGEYAFVARDKAVFQIDSAKAFGGRAPVPFAQKSPFAITPSSTWEDVMNQYSDVMAFFGKIAEGERSRSEGDAAYYPVLIDETGKLNTLGIIGAIHTEFYHSHSNVVKAYDKLLDKKLSSPKLPYCTKQMSTANERSRRTKYSCSGGAFMQIENALRGRDTSTNPNLMSLAEATLILQTAGYLPQTEIPETFFDLAQDLVRSFEASGGTARAQEAVAAYKLLEKEFGGWSLQGWKGM